MVDCNSGRDGGCGGNDKKMQYTSTKQTNTNQLSHHGNTITGMIFSDLISLESNINRTTGVHVYQEHCEYVHVLHIGEKYKHFQYIYQILIPTYRDSSFQCNLLCWRKQVWQYLRCIEYVYRLPENSTNQSIVTLSSSLQKCAPYYAYIKLQVLKLQ